MKKYSRNNEELEKEENEENLESIDLLTPVSHVTLLFGGISDKQASELIAWILMNNMLETPPEELVLLINSPGGDVHSAFAIIEAIKGSKIPVRTIGLGQVVSAGLMIFMSGEKGMRVLTPSCSVMSHSFSTGMSGTYHELSNIRKEIDEVHRKIVNLYTSSTNKPEKYVTKHLLNHNDAYMSPEDAVKFKLADAVCGLENFI